MTVVIFLLLNVVRGAVISTNAREIHVTERKWLTLDGNPPVFMGHRGEKVLMPEHTLGSYEFAAIEGAEYVEPDLVLTKDGYLVCYHDLNLKDGTNVEDLPQFAHLQRNFSEVLDHKNVTILNDWFIADFTLVELQELRVEQRAVGIRPQYFNSIFQIPTFEQYLDVILNMSVKMSKAIGIIPELKHPLYHNSQHSSQGPHHMENKALDTLRSYGYPVTAEDTPRCQIPTSTSVPEASDIVECGHIIIQCFEKESLQYLSTVTNIDLMMLVDDNVEFLTYEGFDEVSQFARYYSIWKLYLTIGAENGSLAFGLVPRDVFVAEGHKRNMSMGVYTIYDSREDPNKEEELRKLFAMGVDFLFVENIQEAREARKSYDCDNQLANAKFTTSSASRVQYPGVNSAIRTIAQFLGAALS